MTRKPKPVYFILGGLFRLFGALLRKWPLFVILLICVSPVGPHVRWEYQYVGSYSNKTYIRCDYMGSRGLLEDVPHLPPDCPFIVILDSRRWVR